MATNVVVPRLGSSDESDQVTIVRWLKAPGARVKKGEALLEVETDKVNVEIEAPDDGVLKEITVPEGETVTFSSVVAVIEKGAE
ncbi:MAG TPA: biotin/lipoyl-containing protein [Candidatus Binatia bacterium]|jgi:pyruvate/2-oxoglutarate dehydrogenase complex dihydrolipoamide acyltransferase (E2) component